jgi:DNA-directed RNA polymerase I, II, and III subunit RPABC2
MPKLSNAPKRPSDTAMAKVKENAVELNDEQIKDTKTTPEIEESLKKSIEAYRNVKIGTKELSEKELEKIDKECEVIEKREIISKNSEHKPVEIVNENGEIILGPPTLTRFEKARILGARALQLSLGAPHFVEIPKNASTSLEIAMEELNRKEIPIVIRRTLPNGDFQNIPMQQFE